jgi:pimeloyl-ACP methyl ester carboxylesterase
MARELVADHHGHRIHVEEHPGDGPAIVLMHGFPDNRHLYDRLLPFLAGRRVVTFDFLGWGRSDKPAGYPYTATNQIGEVGAVVDALDLDEAVLVAHAVVRRNERLDERLFTWQVGRFIRDADVRAELVPRLYADFRAARPAFWRLNDDLLGTVVSRRLRSGRLRDFERPVRIVFGAADPYLNRRVAKRLHRLFPTSELHLLPTARHYVQVDEPQRVADLISSLAP